ncbi:MAG: GerMN domain-containing protein [Defluviitaleaceae bacterium]|nr:GerMN domain-containing protein [Defluviitaleaceae bacterium]
MPNKPRKTQKPRKRPPTWIVGIIALALAIGVAALIRFLGDDDTQPPTIPPLTQIVNVEFHFPVSYAGGWAQEMRQFEYAPHNDLIWSVLMGLWAGPNTQGLERSVPRGLYLVRHALHEDTGELELHFPSAFYDLTTSQRLNLIVSTVYTLTEINFIQGVLFFVDGQPLLGGDGEVFGLRHRGNTTLGVVEQPPTIITLYFPNRQFLWLVREFRSITYDPLVGVETHVVNALIGGPRTEGFYPSIPPETALNSPVERVGDVVFVDFTSDFLTNLGAGFAQEEMMIFSLVNSLTEIEGNRYVQIMIDGLVLPYDHQSTFHIDLSRPIERDESLILNAGS